MIDEVFDTQLSRTLTATSSDIASATEILNRIRMRRINGGRATRAVLAICIAVVALGVGGGVAVALGLIHTVPTQLNFTKPGQGPPTQLHAKVSQQPIPAGATWWMPGLAYRTTLANAKQAAGYPILGLGVGTLQTVTVFLDPQGGKPGVQLDYLVNGAPVSVGDNPAESSTSLQIYIKSGGIAANWHQVTVDGYDLIYLGQTTDSVGKVIFQTAGGTEVSISGGSSPLPDGTLSPPLSLDQYVKLIEGMS
jgi:hypothetical protein